MTRRTSVLLFCLCMGIGTAAGLIVQARPETSSLEKRTLSPFPEFSVSSFLDGSWFSQLSLWYSDSYPGRDQFVTAGNQLKKLNGLSQNERVISSGRIGSAIGESPSSQSDSAASGQNSESSKQGIEERTEIPTVHMLQEDIQGQMMEGLLVRDGSVYGAYYFDPEACDLYTQAINRAADELDGTTSVYSILIPNNSGVLLDQQTLDKLTGSDQKEAIEYYYTKMNDKVTPIETMETLQSHKDEYIYYRTDHHWTSLGAWYVYGKLAEEKGWTPAALESLQTFHDEPFYGSYASTLPDADLVADTFDTWIPSENVMRIYTGDYGNPESDQYYEFPIVDTGDGYDIYSKYLRLSGGDQPFEMIDNPSINDGSSCMIIKESFGSAFIPWLTAHYDKIYIMDIRHADIPIVSFCRQYGVQDLILINNLQIASVPSVAQAYDAKLH